MSAKVIQLGDVGTTLRFTVKENGVAKDISGATVKQLIFRRGLTSITRTADFTTTGSDGSLSYTLTGEDLVLVGAWEVRAHIESIAGKWTSRPDQIEVEST